MRLSPKRVALCVAVAAFSLVCAVGAYGYWTTSGSGSGTVGAATSAGSVTLDAVFSDGIYPGGTKTVTFTADNPGSTSLWIGGITVDRIDVDGAGGCEESDFSLTGLSVPGTVVAASAANVPVGSGTLAFANTPVSQDACKGATVTLDVSST